LLRLRYRRGCRMVFKPLSRTTGRLAFDLFHTDIRPVSPSGWPTCSQPFAGNSRSALPAAHLEAAVRGWGQVLKETCPCEDRNQAQRRAKPLGHGPIDPGYAQLVPSSRRCQVADGDNYWFVRRRLPDPPAQSLTPGPAAPPAPVQFGDSESYRWRQCSSLSRRFPIFFIFYFPWSILNFLKVFLDFPKSRLSYASRGSSEDPPQLSWRLVIHAHSFLGT
jgi:hypothetical protein